MLAQAKFAFGPREVGWGFVVCGLVMTVGQTAAVRLLAGRISEMSRIGAGGLLLDWQPTVERI